MQSNYLVTIKLVTDDPLSPITDKIRIVESDLLWILEKYDGHETQTQDLRRFHSFLSMQ